MIDKRESPLEFIFLEGFTADYFDILLHYIFLSRFATVYFSKIYALIFKISTIIY